VKLTFLVPGEAMRMKRNSHPTACMKLVMTQRGNGEQSTSEKANTVPTAIAKIVPNTLSFYFGLKIRALIQSDSIHLKEGLTRTPCGFCQHLQPQRAGAQHSPLGTEVRVVQILLSQGITSI